MQFRLTVVQGREVPRIVVLESDSQEAATKRAAGEGYTVLSAQRLSFKFGGRVGRNPTAQGLNTLVFIEQMRDLLLAGLSTIEAVGALRRGARGQSGVVIGDLERRLQEGKRLSEVFAAQSAFPPLLVALVSASELTSDLPQALSRFLEHERRVADVRHRVVSVSIYPALLIGIGGAVLLFLLLYVMPRFARVFEGMTGELPWSAQAMLTWSHVLRDHGVWLWLGVGALLSIVAAALASPSIRMSAMRRVLAWRPLRSRLKTYYLARWYRATGMLVQGGIPLLQALALANAVLPMSMRASGALVERGVQEGLTPSAAHVRADMATPVAEQLMLAGERTGDLGTVLARIAHFHESEVSHDIEKVMRGLEPLVMVLIGLGVGVIVVLMYMPIFELASAIR